MNPTNEDDPKDEDPAGDKTQKEDPKGGAPEEKMDIDENEKETHAAAGGTGDVPPMTNQQAATFGSAHLEVIGDSTSTQNLLLKSAPKAKVVMSQANSGNWVATMLPPQHDSGDLTNKQSNGGKSVVRSSKRTAATADQDSTEKAARLKAKKNLELPSDKGKHKQINSFFLCNDLDILNSSSALGIVLGKTEHETLNSIKCLKDIEYNRMFESSKLRDENLVLVEDASTECSVDDEVDFEALNLICSEIAEGLDGTGCDPEIVQPPVPPVRVKANSKVKNKNKNKCNNTSK